MSRVTTFSRKYPSYHSRAGEPTYFIESIWRSLPFRVDYKMICDLNPDKAPSLLAKFWKSIDHSSLTDELRDRYIIKYHTVRAGHRYKPGDSFSPRVWSDNPYHSKQITFAPDLEIQSVWDFEIKLSDEGGEVVGFGADTVGAIARADGLSFVDFMKWFKYPKAFDGQIICWDKSIKY